jgi:crotonobetainyl-CoA:carnitine CoA-transferase CaiB-like acyl-CoA transferase
MISQPETAEIIQFAAIRPKLAKGERPKISGLHAPIVRDGEGLTETCRNLRLRSDRMEAWREADAVMDYWLISMKMDAAISYVQRFDVPEGKLHPVREPKDHETLIERYRLAWCHLMLTPAPNNREVEWKRAQLKAENYEYTGLTPERIEQAIADDIAFLKAHPTRRRDQEQ